jgi:RHS repeat-associated protein
VISWPGEEQTLDGGALPGKPAPTSWWGGLLSRKTDGSGLQYMRNRYYDPKTGKFTQVDPIGLGGGLNLYGFAQGDPVNHSDPFGLCPIEKDGIPCTLTMAAAGVCRSLCRIGTAGRLS